MEVQHLSYASKRWKRALGLQHRFEAWSREIGVADNCDGHRTCICHTLQGADFGDGVGRKCLHVNGARDLDRVASLG